jgi:hypothetical protein
MTNHSFEKTFYFLSIKYYANWDLAGTGTFGRRGWLIGNIMNP